MSKMSVGTQINVELFFSVCTVLPKTYAQNPCQLVTFLAVTVISVVGVGDYFKEVSVAICEGSLGKEGLKGTTET